ncbi:hypothetical protein [Streptomyces sp. NPDC002491]
MEPNATAGTGPDRLVSGTGPDRLISASVADGKARGADDRLRDGRYDDARDDLEDLSDLGDLEGLGDLYEDARAGQSAAAVTAAVLPSFYTPLYGGLHIPVPVTVDRHRVRVKS